MPHATELLTPEHHALIREHGVPSAWRPDLVVKRADGSLHWLPLGIQFFQEALVQHGLPSARVHAIRSTHDLRELCLEIKAIRATRLLGELADATLAARPAPSRRETVAAVLRGESRAFLRAVDRRESLSLGGPNVIPGYFVHDPRRR